MTKLLVVGERVGTSQCQIWDGIARDDPWGWLVRSRAMGALRRGGLAAKLASVGVDVRVRGAGEVPDREGHDSLNLLPPSAEPSAWGAGLAASVAAELRNRLFAAWSCREELLEHGLARLADLDWGRAAWQRGTWRYSGVVMCGRRVAVAMGLPGLGFWESDGGSLLVPHPSGLSREWNHLDVEWARGRVAAWATGLPPA